MNFYTRFHNHNGMRKGGAEWTALSVTFDLTIVVRVRGEQFLYFNIKEKSLVCVTGCRHQKVKGMSKYNFTKLSCNDCTGASAVQQMIELGCLYRGNGDEIIS